jgi:cytochrome b
MTHNHEQQSQHAAKPIRVWDLFVRIFHWSLVCLVAISYLSGEFEFEIHSYSGYAIFSLVLLRVI